MAVIVYAHEGESVYDYFFLNHLIKDNHVYLLTFNEKPDLVPEDVHVVRIPEPFHPKVSPLKGLNAILGSFLRSTLFKKCLNNIKHDVLISCGGLLYGFYSALSDCPCYVLFIWGSDVLVAPKLLPFRFMVKYSLKKAHTVVVDSDVQERACIALGCDPRKIVKFPWVDPRPILNNIEKGAKEVKERLGWYADDPVIISTRHHEPIYNMECLMQAIPHVIKETRNARFLILGTGSLTEKLKKSVSAMGVKGSVKFLGRVPFNEIPKYLKMSNVYVSTSLSDGTSASLIEAMACKLAPVVTDIAGNREWITAGSNGLLFPVRDSKTLAEKIIRLLRDEDSRKSLGMRAYETVVKKADWQRNSKLLDGVVSSIVNIK